MSLATKHDLHNFRLHSSSVIGKVISIGVQVKFVVIHGTLAQANLLEALFMLDVTDPFRMAAVLVYARDTEAMFYAEMRHKEAAQSGNINLAVWWADVHKAVTSLCANTDAQGSSQQALN